MIQANELRIGNLVKDRGGKILKIDYWERAGMVAQNMVVEGMTMHPLTEMVDYLQPIPLTEEWLVRFGFVYEDLGDDPPYEWYVLDKIEIWDFNGKFWLCDMLDQYGVNLELKHVHQLQNLYFALTGQELELK